MKTVRGILWSIWSYVQYPSFLFHEICHIIFIIASLPWIDKILWKDCHFKTYTLCRKGFYSLYFSCEISIDTRYSLPAFLISISPVIGWLTIYFILLFSRLDSLSSYFVFLYFLIGGSPLLKFQLSEADHEMASSSFQLMRKGKWKIS
jgi:hypothetical protein